MVQINWTNRAKEDLKNIAAFISRDSIYYAEKQVQKFYDAVEVLHQYPDIGHPVSEYNLLQLRQILCGKYRIIYSIINESRVDILTVHHSARLLNFES